jgi:hypothetical protein
VTWCTAHTQSHHHIARELDAHEKWPAPWVATGRAPRLVAGDRTAKILVTEFLAGELVLDSRALECLETFRQAGELLANLHAQPGHGEAAYEANENAKVLPLVAGTAFGSSTPER